MTTFSLGDMQLASCWEPMLHPSIRALAIPPLPDINCADCRMVRLGVFTQRTLCCTCVPAFPNFLVGEILEKGTEPELVARWIKEGRGDPLFLYAPPRLIELHQEATFRGQLMLPCPLLREGGECMVYVHRPYLCIGYHCTYTEDPVVRIFWNCLSSLLALHTAVAAQFLLETMGIDPFRFTEAWQGVKSDHDAWTSEDALREDLARDLWQGRFEQQIEFYTSCSRYVRETSGEIRSKLDTYRREQLIRQLDKMNAPPTDRKKIILEQPTDPVPREPPRGADEELSRGITVFANNSWTIPEHESYLLWYYEQAYRNE